MRREIKIAGLEKINAISEAGEGTVFRGHRVKEIETIVKILPYPVHLEKKDDPGTITYLREIKRLKHLNHVPNIHVVKIFQTGLTEKDLFPYIETELIKGPDLDELLTLPNNAVFKLDQVIDLASQLADALAHCHSAMVKHSHINSNNIRLNSETGSYVLLNFGRILLTDEQRKAELEHARAPEYLAPEQYNGEILFETDNYSIGMVLFQVLTGTLPERRDPESNLTADGDKIPTPSIGQQIKERRYENLPLSWTDAEKKQEMIIPVWLSNVVSICLQEDPSKRYSNGIKLQEALKSNLAKGRETTLTENTIASVKPAEKKEVITAPLTTPPAVSSLQTKETTDKPKDADDKDAEIKRLKALIIQKEGQLDVYKYQTADYNPDSNKLNLSKPVFYALLALIALLGAFATYSYFFRKPESLSTITTYSDSDTTGYGADTFQNLTADMYADSLSAIDTAALVRSLPPIPEDEDEQATTKTNLNKSNEEEAKPKPTVKKPVEKKAETSSTTQTAKSTPKRTRSKLEPEPYQNPEYYEPRTSKPVNNKYTLAVAKAYFYDKPDIRTRRPVYLSNANDSELTASEDTNGFIYVVFFNTDREITKGWLRKVDLRRIN